MIFLTSKRTDEIKEGGLNIRSLFVTEKEGQTEPDIVWH